VLRLAIARTLERGLPASTLGALLARGWARRTKLARPLKSALPTLCIGGATLGGSGKTPLAIACARHLASLGHRVALVGHAYRASPARQPRRVRSDDDARVVGDEALECARALASDATVIVARKKQDALDEATRIADVVVLDGPLQLHPPRATLSLLAIDAREPWGSGACPPLGDLRAPKDALVAASDAVVRVACDSRGVLDRGQLIPWKDLRSHRVGLVTGVARPSRVTSFLRERGVVPTCTVRFADHATFELPKADDVDAWITTPKDHARGIATGASVIEYHLDLPQSVARLLETRFPHAF
jgi:tetraacyldisaccharide 4'-kinase